MKEKIKTIKMLIGMLKEKNTGIFICKGKEGTQILTYGNVRNMTNLLGEAIDKDEAAGRYLILGALANIFSKGKVPYLNDEGLEKLQKIALNSKEEQEQKQESETKKPDNIRLAVEKLSFTEGGAR